MRPTVAATADSGDRHSQEWLAVCAYAQELVRAYFCMLTAGCGAADCVSDCCASSSRRPVCLSAGDAAIRSIWLATTAPVPVCASLRSPMLISDVPPTAPRAEDECEEICSRREGDDPEPSADSDGGKRPCTPRRRLSTAMEMAQELRTSDNNGASMDTEVPMASERGAAPSYRPAAEERGQPRGRRMSYTKQKLLKAIRGSFTRPGRKKSRSSETKA